jgi:hypothetical protein
MGVIKRRRMRRARWERGRGDSLAQSSLVLHLNFGISVIQIETVAHSCASALYYQPYIHCVNIKYMREMLVKRFCARSSHSVLESRHCKYTLRERITTCQLLYTLADRMGADCPSIDSAHAIRKK